MIDFHTHVGKERGVEQVRLHIAAHGGGLSVLLPIEPGPASASRDGGMSTAAAAEAHETYPDETIPFCHVDPTSTGAIDRLHSLQAAGIFRGFGEHKVRLPVDHPQNMEIYRLCGEFGWPVLIHMDYTGVYGSNFPAIEQVARALPGTVFVGHAMAWWTNMSADAVTDPQSPEFAEYPMGAVTPIGLTDRLLREYPNLYGDLSARSGYFALFRDAEFGREFVKRHRSKLVWGSDCPCIDGRGNFQNGTFRVCMSSIMLPLLQDYCESDGHFDDITHNNAARLLGLAEN